jgi:hypothetical protein
MVQPRAVVKYGMGRRRSSRRWIQKHCGAYRVRVGGGNGATLTSGVFSARGVLPRDIQDVMARHKDIMYSSRTPTVFKISTWSRNSRRIVPISRSTNGWDTGTNGIDLISLTSSMRKLASHDRYVVGAK